MTLHMTCHRSGLHALLLVLLTGCAPTVGSECDEAGARTVVYSADDVGTPMYAGQALVHRSCGYGSFCHTESEVAQRFGAPAGLDFDVDLASDAADTERLRRGQLGVFRHRDAIWAEVEAGRMPPSGVGTETVAAGPAFRALPEVDTSEGRQILRNWLACGAPVVERTSDSPRPAGVEPVGVVESARPLSCAGGLVGCDGECVDVQSNGLHCGACGVACAATDVCLGGSCSSAGCPAGVEACAGSCVDLQSDADNCGGCGAPCAAGGACVAGSCGCAVGLVDCAGTCSDVASDPSNCGGCDTMCGAGSVCSRGTCLAGCPAGSTECAGACVDTDTSPLHCGGCGNACPGTSTCVAGACDCGDTSSDPMNCGACGVVCASGRACVAGLCECGGGETRCDGLCVDTQVSAAHCGGCGSSCAGTESCEAGACTSCGGDGVTFSGDIQPIFTSTCTGSMCHAGRRPAAGLRLEAGSSHSGLVGGLADGCSDGRIRVVPNAPDDSYLLDKLLGMNMCRGQQMPLMQPNLSSAQTAMFRSWICDGAPDN